MSNTRDMLICAAYICGVVLAIVTQSLWFLGGLFVCLVVLQYVLKTPVLSLIKLIAFALPFLLIIAALQVLGMPQVKMSVVAIGTSIARLSLRMYSLILLSFSLTQALTPLRLSRAFLGLIAPLMRLLRVPAEYREGVALSLSLALSMIPRLLRDYRTIQEAHFVLHLPHRGFRAFVRTLPPLVARCLEEARELEDALTLRRGE